MDTGRRRGLGNKRLHALLGKQRIPKSVPGTVLSVSPIWTQSRLHLGSRNLLEIPYQDFGTTKEDAGFWKRHPLCCSLLQLHRTRGVYVGLGGCRVRQMWWMRGSAWAFISRDRAQPHLCMWGARRLRHRLADGRILAPLCVFQGVRTHQTKHHHSLPRGPGEKTKPAGPSLRDPSWQRPEKRNKPDRGSGSQHHKG